MKAKSTMLVVSILIAGFAGTEPALGADESSMPAEKVQGVASYVTGGVGEEETAAFKRAAAAYPLELQFAQKAQPRDEFLSDVQVTIRNRSGKVVLDATAEGPFLLAKLPPGSYRIEADYGGQLKRQAVEIHAGKHRRVVFVWVARDS